MKDINPFLLTDFYKVGHIFQYPKGTTLVYSNLTPRQSRIKGIDKMVVFGIQYFIKKYLIEYFDDNFFNQPLEEVINPYKRRIVNALGADLPSYKHLEDLHKLGYLPIEIKALPEGSRVPMRVPYLTIKNTLPEFFWLTNALESLMSTVLWVPSTSATIAYQYRTILNHYGNITGVPQDFVQWEGHDFSFRGMSSPESGIASGMGHLLSFTGTDTIAAIDGLEQWYNADSDKELIGGSVAATEHSVMSAGGVENEFDTYKRLITEVYPSGIVSIVSDTWNLWEVITDFLPRLKKEIMARNGKIVIRPDSGDPVLILTGNPAGKTEDERKGVIELLWEVFGGIITPTGYKMLDGHIGTIYGDSITTERAEAICSRLEKKGFASQSVLGIGSFTYQYNTRDTFGTAMKCTFVEISGVGKPVFKHPVTDDGTKFSAMGLLKVIKDSNGDFILIDNVTWDEEQQGELKTVFRNGKLTKDFTLAEIRKNLWG
jgi:nicotinamide phosphoribosyltransferase